MPSPSELLAPQALVQLALTKAQASFTALYGDSLLCLVRLGPGAEELSQGLEASAVPGEVGAPKLLPAIRYKTEFVNLAGPLRAPAARPAPRAFDAQTLRHDLGTTPHFIVPLRRRVGAETLYEDRVSVGRATNKDIVLRHPSVSKFHGWFEIDDHDQVSFADAGSKNGSQVEGVALAPRALTRVHAGDRLALGSVEALLTTAEVLWSSLHGRGAGSLWPRGS